MIKSLDILNCDSMLQERFNRRRDMLLTEEIEKIYGRSSPLRDGQSVFTRLESNHSL